MSEFESGKSMIDPESGELVDSMEYMKDVIGSVESRLETRQASLERLTELYERAKQERE